MTNFGKLMMAIYITIVVFAISFLFGYVEQEYHLVVPYSNYVFSLALAVAAIALGYAFISIMASIVERYMSKRLDKVGTNIVKFVSQVIAYVILLLILFDIFNISPSTLLVEGAVGGVIIGLALQTIIPLVFSGVFINSSKVLTTGEVIVLESSWWGVTNPKFCKVKKVGVVFTQFHDSGGHLITVPNTLLLNYSVITKLEERGIYKYNLTVSIKNDVRADDMERPIEENLKRAFEDSDLQMPQAYFVSTTDKTLVYSVAFYFLDIYQVDVAVDKINKAFDRAYWSLKDEEGKREARTHSKD